MFLTKRRNSTCVLVGDKQIGGSAPVLIQSMTNTATEDIEATAAQVRELAAAGSQIVRLTVNTRGAAQAVPAIVCRLERQGLNIPLVGDFHYNGHLLLKEFPDCARLLAKYRINPGNVGHGDRHDENFKQMIDVALNYNKPIRIGVNWGSLDQDLLSAMMDANARRKEPLDAHEVLIEAIVASSLSSAGTAESFGMPHNQIVLSAKVSDVCDLVQVYRRLAGLCDYALHLGLTEAGISTPGIISTTAALSILLAEGIGDTIRASLTPEPGASRINEVTVCQQILQALGLQLFTPQVAACPGCGRTTSTVFQELAGRIQSYLADRRKSWQERYPGSESLRVAVMGCIVNGPGESRHAHIGISLPGSGEEPRAPVFADGKHITTLSGPSLAEDFIELLNNYVEARWGNSRQPAPQLNAMSRKEVCDIPR